MAIRNINDISKKIKSLLKKYKSEIKKEPNLAGFIELFFDKVLHDKLILREDEYLFNLAKSCFLFAKERKNNEPKIKIAKRDSQNTIIEVITDDMPFIVDSLVAEINNLGFEVETIINRVVCVNRDGNGKIKQIYAKNPNNDKFHKESILHFSISYTAVSESLEILEQRILYILELVKIAVSDWAAMLDKLEEIKNQTLSVQEHNQEHIQESLDFFNWIKDKSFVFLGYAEYTISTKKLFVKNNKNDNKKLNFKIKNNSKLGIFKEYNPDDLVSVDYYDNYTNNLIEINKCQNKSLIHRSVHLDNIRIKKYDKIGNVVAECRFLGLFTSKVFYQHASTIPLIRKKIANVTKASKFNFDGHNGKELLSILESYPVEELFQIKESELFDIAIGIASLSGRLVTKIFVRYDQFKRFVSIICYTPKKHFGVGLLNKIEGVLSDEFQGQVVARYTQISDSLLARVQFIINIDQNNLKQVDYNNIEKQIARIASLWQDRLFQKLKIKFNEKEATSLYNAYGEAFSVSYTDVFSTQDACNDIELIGSLISKGMPTFKLAVHDLDKHIFSLRIYSYKEQIILSKIMPILENFGLKVIDEHTYLINPAFKQGSENIWLYDFKIILKNVQEHNFIEVKKLFEAAILDCWLKKIENDNLNKLIVSAKLSARDISLIRAYAKYLLQTDFSYSLSFISEVLCNNANFVKYFVKLFYAKFFAQNITDIKNIENKINVLLENIENLSEDIVLRKFLEILKATLRTNFFQLSADNQYKDYISFKLQSAHLTDIPLPKPYAEIFVYSATMEGVHLRGGKVARGGLRWSDRKEDFRTEIQGLVKAQMTKNSVIVPVGSKGGFVVKDNLTNLSKDEFLQAGINVYKTFLSGLLDITDNIINGKILAPQDVIRYDDDDPYLVVAADKGTASFSDIANEISNQYNFWLGDAFASGGSQGYNHKEMGITAKGAWVSVKRHFYELGKDIDKEDFTVVGIGGMAGDVFGNGMLLSKNIKLLAAFNHIHIFIDPDPDPKISYKERQRLFNLAGSNWSDYKTKLLSKGGAIYERSEKTINITKQAKNALGLTKTSFAPSELIQALLKAPVDLLWNGGIGTYVKAVAENNIEVGDRANDTLRVDAKQLRCKIIGEGGNLGLTQKGRIEYALNGGRINTDSVDNSAGVDCSDHEVNIKIALQNAIVNKDLTIVQRNKILKDMTEDVERLVLRDNFLQTQAITIAQYQGVAALEQQERLMLKLEKEGILDRSVEFLPNSEEIAMRRSEGIGLTRPELSVLLSYSKIYLYNNLLNSNLPDDDYFHNDLISYFPDRLAKKFYNYIKDHNLKREIIATFVSNSLVNRLGITFFYRLCEDTGLRMCDIARSYTITRKIFSLYDLWCDIENLSGKIAAKTQIEMYRDISSLIEASTAWFIRSLPQPLTDISEIEKDFRLKIATIYENLDEVLAAPAKKSFYDKIKYYIDNNVPKEIARRVAAMDVLSSACQIVQVARGKNIAVDFVAKIYYTIGMRMNLRYLRLKALDLQIDTYWDKLSIKSYIDNLFDQQARITDNIVNLYLENKSKLSLDDLIDLWCNNNHKQVTRFAELVLDIQSHDHPDFAMLNVAGNRIKEVGYIV